MTGPKSLTLVCSVRTTPIMFTPRRTGDYLDAKMASLHSSLPFSIGFKFAHCFGTGRAAHLRRTSGSWLPCMFQLLCFFFDDLTWNWWQHITLMCYIVGKKLQPSYEGCWCSGGHVRSHFWSGDEHGCNKIRVSIWLSNFILFPYYWYWSLNFYFPFYFIGGTVAFIMVV